MPSTRKCPAEPRSALNLGALRRRFGLSQNTLADRLQVTQPHVAKFEAQADMRLSTLKRYIRALGGELQLVARFSGSVREIELPAATEEALAPCPPGRPDCQKRRQE
jgi:transcriptional regulator with XRE-family HTH domain